MSVPYQTISCVKCGYGQWSSVLIGKFVWRDDKGREASMDRELGYCLNCEKIVAKEKLPTVGSLDKASEIAPASLVGRLIAKVRRMWRGPHSKIAIGQPDRRDSPEVLMQVINLGRIPVCLDCGSERVISIPKPMVGRNDHSVTHTGVIHPGCGGEFVVQGSGGSRFAFQIVKRVYDIKGQLIETEPRSA